MNIPFFSFRLAPQELRAKWKDVASEVIDSGNFLQSDWNKIFSENFSKKMSRKFALGVSNGLDGITLSLRSLNLSAGKRVAVPSHTFIAVWNAVLSVGAEPVAIEVDDDGQINLEKVALAHSIQPIDAVIVVHMHGFPISLSGFRSWCDYNNVLLIEDCSQAHFAKTQDGVVGKFGDVAVFSHYPSKNLPALGDAGTIVCDDQSLYEKIKVMANYGSDLSNKYVHHELGYNCRMDSIQAAILDVNLKLVEEWNSARINLACLYETNLQDLPVKILHKISSGSVFHHYCILVKERSKLIRYLSDHGIETNIHYPIPPYREVSKWKGYYNLEVFSCETADKISSTTLSLPISQWHTPEMIIMVSETIKQFYYDA
jgi:dTDP-4-amino-4,6-dideoxygalactose transaminase